MTADSDPSGLGTAIDCTKRRNRPVQGSPGAPGAEPPTKVHSVAQARRIWCFKSCWTPGKRPAWPDAWSALAVASGVVTADALAEEFETLFIGVGRAPVMPYGSFYQAGFLNEKPLAELRTDLARMGFARDGGARETEDHLAALCDVMRAMILGDVANVPASLVEQKVFFLKHLQPWGYRMLRRNN